MGHAAPLSILLTLAVTHVGATTAHAQQNQPRQQARQGDQPPRVRVTFGQFSARNDSNRDGKIDRDEFKGAPQFFRWLDQNGDGRVTADEFQTQMQRDGHRQPGRGRVVPEGIKVMKDLEYANVDGESLRLDLYLPEKSGTKPLLLVWIHGGGWTKGSKSGINPVFIRLTAEGYAAASIDYRLDGLISHPRHIHDCKPQRCRKISTFRRRLEWLPGCSRDVL